MDGLLSGIARKTGWMMAEQAGLSRPWRIQALLGRSRWDADALRDEVRAYALEALGCADGVLVVDETGFVKKGRHSVGVARQYTGTAGRVENSQVGVFLAYASHLGQALIDRRLYLPRAWAEDGARRAKTQVPDEIGFATKPALARAMLAAALPPQPGLRLQRRDPAHRCELLGHSGRTRARQDRLSETRPVARLARA